MSKLHGLATQNLTTISISKDNYLVLKKMGQTGDSFNDVLTRILQQLQVEEASGAAPNY